MTAERDGRERILREARTLFLHRGYTDVSMQQIADAVGMTKAALYYHFRSKEDLFMQVCLQEFRRLRQAAEGVIARHRSLRDRLTGVAEILLDYFQGELHRMMDDVHDHHLTMDRDEELKLEGEFHREFAAAQETMRRCFEDTEPAVELRVAPSVAALIYSHMLLSVGHQMHMPDTVPVQPEEMVSSIIEVFMHGAVTSPSPGKARRADRVARRGALRVERQTGRASRRRPIRS